MISRLRRILFFLLLLLELVAPPVAFAGNDCSSLLSSGEIADFSVLHSLGPHVHFEGDLRFLELIEKDGTVRMARIITFTLDKGQAEVWTVLGDGTVFRFALDQMRDVRLTKKARDYWLRFDPEGTGFARERQVEPDFSVLGILQKKGDLAGDERFLEVTFRDSEVQMVKFQGYPAESTRKRRSCVVAQREWKHDRDSRRPAEGGPELPGGAGFLARIGAKLRRNLPSFGGQACGHTFFGAGCPG